MPLQKDVHIYLNNYQKFLPYYTPFIEPHMVLLYDLWYPYLYRMASIISVIINFQIKPIIHKNYTKQAESMICKAPVENVVAWKKHPYIR